MKKLLPIIVSLLISAAAGAQIVNIPDAAFKSVLLSATADNDVARNLDNDPAIIDTNNDNEIQVSEALNISRLDVSAAGIYSLEGIEAFINLDHFECADNYLDTLPISALINLEELDCANNNITDLELSALINISELICGGNPFTTLDVSEQANLEIIDCTAAVITELDLSNNPLLVNFIVNDCISLQYLNIKNGTILPAPELSGVNNTPQLSFICVDEGEAAILELYFSVYMSTYCTFTPGGAYNTIMGTVKYDAGNDGCDASDLPQQFVKLKLSDGLNEGCVFTNASGAYNFYTGAGDYTVVPEFEDNYFTATPASASVNFPIADNSVATEDFCITANGTSADIEVVMVPVIPAQPGFDAVYKIVYRNKGNTVLSGTVNCQWDPAPFELINLVPNADISMQGDYTWNFSNLQPFENREILMTLNVNSPSDTPPVNIDDELLFTANAVVTGDSYPGDNSFALNQIVVGSFDPNNIICIQGETEPADAIGEYLHYVVNFENTGTAPASFVVVRHDFNATDFDVASLQMLNSSHDVSARIVGNTAEFIFQNINLQAAGHGNILFRVRTRSSVMANDMVTNNAKIFFDYNLPIATNDANTTFEILSKDDFAKDASVTVYPNPVINTVNLSAASTITSVQLYDIQGRLLQINTVNSENAVIDISNRQSGVYFIKVITEKGSKVEKLVKQ